MGITYESIGYPAITVTTDPNGVTALANADGFASLARHVSELAELERDDHLHLTSSMQLDDGSEALTVALQLRPHTI